MGTKILEWVDIKAPRDDVFSIITDLEKRSQLSPLWGVSKIEDVTADYPEAGSRYQVRLREGQLPPYTTVITEVVPLRKFAYQLLIDRQTMVTWTFQDSAQGTRVTYHEEFNSKETDGEEFPQAVRRVVKQWLENIKRYAELREGRGKRLVRWCMDCFYLRMRIEQRRVVQTILFLHALGLISFVMTAITIGIANLLRIL